MTKQREPWRDGWTRGKELGCGGHGKTYLARPVTDIEGPDVVLKLLLNQRSPERRHRMHREASALRTLTHKGIPRLIDSNSDQFADLETQLYLVEELVPGNTLEKCVRQSTLAPDIAIQLFRELLCIVQYCHMNQVLHRDIKPDNIVLRNSDFGDPVLIDFGQSYNADDDDNVTWTGQHLGNRFIMLPELHGPKSHQRDPRSDLTQLCGVLFFAVTGKYPGSLSWEGQRPHERPEEQATICRFPDHAMLLSIFDRAFVEPLDSRWQSGDSLLEHLANPQPYRRAKSMEEVMRALDAHSKILQGGRVLPTNWQEQFEFLLNYVVIMAKQVVDRFPAFRIHSGTREIDSGTFTIRTRIGLVAASDSSIAFLPLFEMRAVGTEYVLTITPDGEQATTVFREPIQGFAVPPPGLPDRIKDFLIRGMTAKLGE